MLHDWCGNVANGDSHVVILCHGCVRVKVLDVHGHELRSRRCGYHTVEYTFRCGQICCFGASTAVASVLNFVTSDGEAHTLFDFLIRFVGYHDLEVLGGFLAVRRNLRDINEMDRFRTEVVPLARLLPEASQPISSAVPSAHNEPAELLRSALDSTDLLVSE